MSEFKFTLPHPEPLVIVISGPSGVGKDTVIQRMKERNLPFHFVVTAATRLPRPNEVDGRDYFFYSHDEFAEMIEKGELLEYAIVYNDYKGIPKAQVEDALSSGKDVIMRLDVQGAATIRKLCPDALMIFLTIQDEQDMVSRLQARKTETPEGLKLRIATARQEMTHVDSFDYVVINREYHLDETVDIIVSIIVAEHHRVKQRKITL
ncbi:MAG: guanylate kinase [Chloroflexi bacterium RBG_13_50_21]|nr:MAG: guanylate kinase [Chloroflexi bacterium RBG_13_50_21]OGO62397.1 MAG: guanylate kinase [Chloroflexi bacterium RBG_19FT_COMBO_47_9]